MSGEILKRAITIIGQHNGFVNPKMANSSLANSSGVTTSSRYADAMRFTVDLKFMIVRELGRNARSSFVQWSKSSSKRCYWNQVENMQFSKLGRCTRTSSLMPHLPPKIISRVAVCKVYTHQRVQSRAGLQCAPLAILSDEIVRLGLQRASHYTVLL